jgi:hypothetical protein
VPPFFKCFQLAQSTFVMQGFDSAALQEAEHGIRRQQAMGAHPLACLVVLLLVAANSSLQNVPWLLLMHSNSDPTTETQPAAAFIYVPCITIFSVIASGVLCDRYFSHRTIHSLTHNCTVHHRQASHALAALALVAAACLCSLFLLLHPLSPFCTTVHPALYHALVALRTVASSSIIAPAIACVARSTAPYALPLSFATMVGGEIAMHTVQLAYRSCGPLCDLFARTSWFGIIIAAVELLLCLSMLALERHTAITLHLRTSLYDQQIRIAQVHARCSVVVCD